jgi:hypothetical protein
LNSALDKDKNSFEIRFNEKSLDCFELKIQLKELIDSNEKLENKLIST